MKHATIAMVFAALLAWACGGPTATSGRQSSASSTQGQSSISSTAAPASSNAAPTLFTLAPEPGTTVRGTVQVAIDSGSVTLTAKVNGLDPGHSYIVDADPLPCQFFEGGPSQSFSKPLTVDATGNGRVVWAVPSGMAGNANVQLLTSQSSYAVLACADLSP
jgi:hypothetical protein